MGFLCYFSQEMGQVNVKYRAYDHGFLFLEGLASYSYVDDIYFGLKKLVQN